MNEKILKATHGTPDHPLTIGDIKIPCYVLEDGRRVLSQTGLLGALALSRGSSAGSGGDRLHKFAAGKGLESHVSKELVNVTENPIKFKAPHGGKVTYGYEATILADLCEAVLKARDAKALQKQQLHIAVRCEILMRGFARVGIIALVDEATGYQEVRDKIALRKILDKYLLVEYAKWAKRFPDEFYELMFKLKGWQWKGMAVNRPSVVGKYTNDLVYERLAPGILTELKKLNPPDEQGKRKTKHQQWLTEDIGHPALQKHLAILIAFMKAASNWSSFHRNVARALPKLGETIPMALDED